MGMLFGGTFGFAAIKSSSKTLNLSAISLIVSPDCTTYVNGVGLGRGVSLKATIPSATAGVALGVRVK
jgi:hypothetical protein